MTLSTQPYKGSRDFYPEDKRLQKYMFRIMREVCERYGYEEYDAPILEPTELYLSKGNEEIIADQTFTFTDRGNRSVTLRTEMTPSVSRMVAGRRQELSYPVRWYSIPQCWRYERTQRGRGREFYQLNVDIFGVENILADIEMIVMSDSILKAFGAKRDMYVIKVNSRQLVDTYLKDGLKLDPTQVQSLIRLIDRMYKMEAAEFKALVDAVFQPSQREAGEVEDLMKFLQAKNLDELPEMLQSSENVNELRELLESLDSQGLTNVVFDGSLMRGFDYYTDIVFEVFDVNPTNNRSMFGGGRYDGLVELFGSEKVPAAGFAMGDITLMNFLEANNLLPTLYTEAEVAVIAVGDLLPDAWRITAELREMGLNISLDMTDRKIDKQIKSAVKRGVPYMLFVGKKELDSEQFTLKNTKTNEESSHSLERIVSMVKDFRSKD